MADEYRDIGTIEELTVYCLGKRSGAAVEYFTEMISLKKKMITKTHNILL